MPTTIITNSSVTTGYRASGTTYSVTAPSVSDGDLLVAVCRSGAGFARTTSPPSGWAELFRDQQSIGGSDQNHYVWLKIASSEPGSYTFTAADTFTNSTTMMLSLQNAASYLINTVEYVIDTPSNNPVVTGTITPSDNSSLVLRTIMGTFSSTFTPPSGQTEIHDANVNSICTMIAKAPEDASATGTKSFTESASWFAKWSCVLAFAPAASGGPWPHHMDNQSMAGMQSMGL